MVDDSESTVVLLNKEKPNHLVGEGHGGKGELVVGAGVDIGGKAIGTAYDIDDAGGAEGLALLYVVGKA